MTRKVVFRDSRNGQFIPKEVAERRPATTEKEVVNVPTPKKK